MSDQESATSRDPQTAEPLETSASPSSAGGRPHRAPSIVAVICVIATKVTDAIAKQVDIEAILKNVFAGVITDRPRLERLVGPLSA